MNAFQLSPTTTYYSGQQFGNYQLVSLLARGGFALVYLGKHRYLGTQAAVKILHTSLTDADVENFSAEARIAAQLVHPHIIRVLEFGQEGKIPFLIMDYAPNGTLRQRYSSGSRPAPNVIIENVRQIAEALQYIHDRGFIHRDIKPENLLLQHNDKLLLSDFGISIAAHTMTASDSQMTVGTIAYMAPEQIQAKPCFASDQYALGIVVYEWLCGVLPFEGLPSQIAYQHLYMSPPPLCESIPAIPIAVEDVVLKSLAKNPQERFGSVQEFAIALRAAFRYRPIVQVRCSQPALNDPTFRQPIRAKKNKKQCIWKEICALLAFDLLTAIALGIFLYGLGVTWQSVWFLFSLCIVLPPLGSAFVKRNCLILSLTSSTVIIAVSLGVIFHNFTLFVVVYLSLLLISLLVAFTTAIRVTGYPQSE